MLVEDLRALLDELAQVPALWAPDAFAARAMALDRLEWVTLGYEESPGGAAGGESRAAGLFRRGEEPASAGEVVLLRQAEAVKRRLQAANDALCNRLRAAIRRGALRGAEVRRTLERLSAAGDPGLPAAEGEYDLLDSLVSELLLGVEPPAPVLRPAAERVAYQPAPARVALDLLDRVPLGPPDLFYDLGAGLGQVCLLVHLLSGARTRGIEVEPAYCSYARQRAEALGLGGVEFVEADVLEASLEGGACYFLYSPFRGRTLEQALDRLLAAARGRLVTVAAYGPCVEVVARRPWLEAIDNRAGTGLAVFRSR